MYENISDDMCQIVICHSKSMPFYKLESGPRVTMKYIGIQLGRTSRIHSRTNINNIKNFDLFLNV